MATKRKYIHKRYHRKVCKRKPIVYTVIIFDYKKGFKEARTRLENPKEEYEKLKLI